MKVKRNLLAGISNSVISALLGIAVIPFYLKYLGVESYGLIGFFATMQAMLQVLDIGISPTINREVARCSAIGKLSDSGRLLHTLAVVYWGVAAIIVLTILMISPLISKYWLESKHLPSETILHAVMLMGLVIACRWPVGLYQGAIIGAQRSVLSSIINMIMAIVGNLGAVGVLLYISPTIEAFFIWQAIVGLAYAIFMRWGAWKVIGNSKAQSFDLDVLKNVWRFTAGMSAIALSGIILSQLDKVILSSMLSLELFGHYMLATAIVSGIYLLILPVFNIIYPRFSALLASGSLEELTKIYRLGSRMLAVFIFPSVMFLVLFGQNLVAVWTGNQEVAKAVAPVISILAMGSALHGMMYFPYALQLAYGDMRLPLNICTILIICMVPLIIIFTRTYGLLGGAIAWLTLQIIYMILGVWLTHRKILNGLGPKWLIVDVGLPLLVSIFFGLTWKYLIQINSSSDYWNVLLGLGVALFATVASILMTPKLRSFIFDGIRSKINYLI